MIINQILYVKSFRFKLNNIYVEMWKAVNQPDYPLDIIPANTNSENNRLTRSTNSGNLPENGRSNVVQKSFVGDATRCWNTAPANIKMCKSLVTVKKEIKKYVRTIPI
jgi:hypothetical protein